MILIITDSKILMTIERERLLCDNVDRRSGVFSQGGGGGGRVGGKGGVLYTCLSVRSRATAISYRRSLVR